MRALAFELSLSPQPSASAELQVVKEKRRAAVVAFRSQRKSLPDSIVAVLGHGTSDCFSICYSDRCSVLAFRFSARISVTDSIVRRAQRFHAAHSQPIRPGRSHKPRFTDDDARHGRRGTRCYDPSVLDTDLALDGLDHTRRKSDGSGSTGRRRRHECMRCGLCDRRTTPVPCCSAHRTVRFRPFETATRVHWLVPSRLLSNFARRSAMHRLCSFCEYLRRYEPSADRSGATGHSYRRARGWSNRTIDVCGGRPRAALIVH